MRNDYAGTGYIDGGRKQITAWLYRALFDNVPYDRFVRELISPQAESEGFIKGIKWRGRVNASQVREIQFSQNVSQVFFGINMKCASCHDSFIDRWKLTDAYGLAAVIADEPLEMARCDKPTGKIAAAEVSLARAGDDRRQRAARQTTGAAGRAGDTSGQRPVPADDRQPDLAAADGPRDRPPGRRDGQRALERGSSRIPGDLSGRPRLRLEGADRAHRPIADLPVEPGDCLRRGRRRGLRFPRPDGETDDRRAVSGRRLVRHRDCPGARPTSRFTRRARRPRPSTGSCVRHWSSPTRSCDRWGGRTASRWSRRAATC